MTPFFTHKTTKTEFFKYFSITSFHSLFKRVYTLINDFYIFISFLHLLPATAWLFAERIGNKNLYKRYCVQRYSFKSKVVGKISIAYNYLCALTSINPPAQTPSCYRHQLLRRNLFFSNACVCATKKAKSRSEGGINSGSSAVPPPTRLRDRQIAFDVATSRRTRLLPLPTTFIRRRPRQ